MRRLRTDKEQAAHALTEACGVGKPKRQRGISPAKAREQLNEMLVANDFASAKPTHLVALYEWCHERVYGVVPAELTPKVWRGAMFAAARMLKDEFSGDVQAMVAFVRWVWRREQVRERRRREGADASSFRISWRLQFVTKHLITDYRIDLARS